jgi:hypothetical protein
MFAKCQGPFVVKRKLDPINYEVDLGHRLITLHINMLKRFYEPAQFVGVVLTADEAEDCDETEYPVKVEREKSRKCLIIGSHLTVEQQQQMKMLLDEFPDVLSDKTSSTDLITHTIRLTDEIPCSRPACRIPDSLKPQVEDEIPKLLE